MGSENRLTLNQERCTLPAMSCSTVYKPVASVSANVAIDAVASERRLPSGRSTVTVVAPGSGTMVTGSAGWKLWLGTLGGSIHSLRFCTRMGKAIRSGRSDS